MASSTACEAEQVLTHDWGKWLQQQLEGVGPAGHQDVCGIVCSNEPWWCHCAWLSTAVLAISCVQESKAKLQMSNYSADQQEKC